MSNEPNRPSDRQTLEFIRRMLDRADLLPGERRGLARAFAYLAGGERAAPHPQ